jgi:hypothetical protein
MNEKAWIRKLNGQPVTFIEFTSPADVLVSIGGEWQTLSRSFWRTLPLWG